VKSLLDEDGNDVTLASTGGWLAVALVDAGQQGDLTLQAAGAVTGVTGLVRADVVTVRAAGAVKLDTDARSLDVETSVAGAITLADVGSVTLANIQAFDGSIAATAAADPQAGNVRTLSGTDAGDISLAAGGPLAVGSIPAAGPPFRECGPSFTTAPYLVSSPLRAESCHR